MPGYDGLAKALIILGGILVAAGILLWVGGHWFNLGRLPGDVYIRREGYSVYFPLATSILVSLILTLILNLIFRR